MKTTLTIAVPVIAALLAATYPMIGNAAGDKSPVDPNSQSMTTSSWDSETQYWRGNYASRPYYNANRTYDAMEPAYRYGYDTAMKNTGKRYEDLSEKDLSTGWTTARGKSSMSWDDAKPAVHDAYMRAYDGKKRATSTSKE